MKSLYRQNGFTVIELMITVAVVAILLAVGLPSYDNFIKNSRLTAGNNALATDLTLARSEAVKRGLRVTACKSANQASCTTSNNWQQGWIVFTDQDNNASYSSATETLIRAHGALSDSISAVGSGAVSNYVSYVSSGRTLQVGGGLQTGNITICDDRTGAFGKRLSISATGRLSAISEVNCP